MSLQLAFSNPFMRRLLILSLAAAALVYGAVRLRSADVSASRTAVLFPAPAVDISTTAATEEQTAVFAGGCFWGMEGVFEHLQGVSGVSTGYTGGSAESAHYEEVSAGTTAHAEAVKITYNPSQISYGQLLKVYFSVAHDPTQFNRQGPDTGKQYRSAIFFVNEQQKQIAQAYIDQLNQAQVFARPIVTQLASLNGFYNAEDYHQDFIKRHPYHPYVVLHDLPQIAQLKKLFPEQYRE